MDPVKKTMTVTKGNYQIPGYSGFVPGIQSENLYAGTYASITAGADTLRDRKVENEVRPALPPARCIPVALCIWLLSLCGRGLRRRH